MAPKTQLPPKAAPTQRKRNRKRKRRAVSSSSSSSAASDSESVSSTNDATIKAPRPQSQARQNTSSSSSSSESSESSSDSDSDSSSASESSPVSNSGSVPRNAPEVEGSAGVGHSAEKTSRRSPSPDISPVPLPTILPSAGEEDKERLLKEKFRRFWMSAVADGFKNDLEELRKEPNLDAPRLSMLIDSLASGADVFSSSQPVGTEDVNEMEIVVGAQ